MLEGTTGLSTKGLEKKAQISRSLPEPNSKPLVAGMLSCRRSRYQQFYFRVIVITQYVLLISIIHGSCQERQNVETLSSRMAYHSVR